MIGVVLAAGLGRRLGQGPKALFDLDGASMIERAAATLRNADIRHLVVVTGFDRDRVIEHCQTLRFDDVEFIHNDRYAELNNFHSDGSCCSTSPSHCSSSIATSCSCPRSSEQPTSADHDLAIVADRSTVDDEAMGVCVVGGRATGIGKHLSNTECVGEFIGMSVLRPAARRRYLDYAAGALRLVAPIFTTRTSMLGWLRKSRWESRSSIRRTGRRSTHRQMFSRAAGGAPSKRSRVRLMATTQPESTLRLASSDGRAGRASDRGPATARGANQRSHEHLLAASGGRVRSDARCVGVGDGPSKQFGETVTRELDRDQIRATPRREALNGTLSAAATLAATSSRRRSRFASPSVAGR